MNIEQAKRHIAELIKRRKDAGERVKDIARDAGLDPITIWKWEQGQIGDGAVAAVRLLESSKCDDKAA